MLSKLLTLLLVMQAVSCVGQVSIGAGVTLGSGVVIGTPSTTQLFPAPPAYAFEFSNIQGLSPSSFSVDSGAASSGGSNTGSPDVTHDNATPSLSGSSIYLGETAADGFNEQVFTVLCSGFTSGNCANITDAVVDAYIYIPSTASIPHGIEGPNLVFYTGTMQMYPSIQCATQSSSTTPNVPTWNVWDSATGHWVTLNISCAAVLTTTNTWQHFQVHYQVDIATGTLTYDTFVVNNAVVFQNLGLTFDGESYTGGNSLKAQFQIDGTETANSTTGYYIDDWNIWVWAQ